MAVDFGDATGGPVYEARCGCLGVLHCCRWHDGDEHHVERCCRTGDLHIRFGTNWGGRVCDQHEDRNLVTFRRISSGYLDVGAELSEVFG